MEKDLISRINEIILEYHISHRAPNRSEENAPLYDVGDMFPDMYNDKAEIYCRTSGDNFGICNNLIKKIQSYYNKPNKDITIYRSIPISVENKTINDGDWVTLSPEHAK